VACADVVITKPGYGIVSEAIAAGTAVLYTRRGDFREQQLLIDGLHRFTRSQEIDNARLRSGDWGESLETLCQSAFPAERLPTHGDVVVAERLAAMAVGGGQ
jgi:L-arabinokinase